MKKLHIAIHIVCTLVIIGGLSYFWATYLPSVSQKEDSHLHKVQEQAGEIQSLKAQKDDVSKKLSDLEEKLNSSAYQAGMFNLARKYEWQNFEFNAPYQVQETIGDTVVSVNEGGGQAIFDCVCAEGLYRGDMFVFGKKRNEILTIYKRENFGIQNLKE